MVERRTQRLLENAHLQVSTFGQTQRLHRLDQAIHLYGKALRAMHVTDESYASTSSELVAQYRQRSLQTKDIRDVDKALYLGSQAIGRLPVDHAQRPRCILELARSFGTFYVLNGDRRDLEESIKLYTDLLEDLPPSLPRFTVLNELGDNLGARFDRDAQLMDLNHAIRKYQQAQKEGSRDVQWDLWPVLNSLGHRLRTRSRLYSRIEDLDDAIACHRQALELRTDEKPLEVRSLRELALCHQQRFEFGSDRPPEDAEDDLGRAVEYFQQAMALSTSLTVEDEYIFEALDALLSTRFEQSEDAASLDQTIKLKRRMLPLYTNDRPGQAMAIRELAICLGLRFRQRGDIGDINDAVALFEKRVPMYPDQAEDPEGYLDALRDLAACLETRFERNEEQEDIDRAIQLKEDLVCRRPLGHPGHPNAIRELAVSLQTRFQKTRDLSDISQAVEHLEERLRLRPEGHSDHPKALQDLVTCLNARIERSKDSWDIKRADELSKRLAVLRPDDSTNNRDALRELAVSLRARFERSGDSWDIDQAIRLQEDLLNKRSVRKPDHLDALRELAISLRARFDQRGDISDINKAVDCFRRRLLLCPEDHPDSRISIGELAESLDTRFRLSEDRADIDGAIRYKERCLELSDDSRLDFSDVARSLAASLHLRFRQSGDIPDIERAISLNEQAVVLTEQRLDLSQGNADHVDALRSLAVSLETRFHQSGDIADLDRTVDLSRHLVRLHATDDPERYDALRELAIALHTRFGLTRSMEDINETIELLEERLHLRPEGTAKHANALRELAVSLHTRFKQSGDPSDIDRAVDRLDEHRGLRPEGHPDHPNALRDLASALDTRIEWFKNRGDMDQVVELRERVARSFPQGHSRRPDAIQDLAASLRNRFENGGDPSDIDRATKLHEELQTLRLNDHRYHYHADALRTSTTKITSLGTDPSEINRTEATKIIDQYRKASVEMSVSVLDRLIITLEWPTVAERLGDESRMEAHTSILRLLETFLAQTCSLQWRYLTLLGSPAIRRATRSAVDAAALAIAGGRPELGVLMLEQCRSVVFRQLTRLRVQLDDVSFVAPRLAETFAALSGRLEALAVAGPQEQSQRLLMKPRRLGEDSEYLATGNYAEISTAWSQVVEEIRGIYGFQSFLQPSTFRELQWAAEAGPIILVNISAIRSDAIIIAHKVDCPIIIPLPEATPEQVQHLAAAFGSEATQLGTLEATILLRALWGMIVEPIAETLRGPGLELKYGSRIWWCPTGDAARLPLHGAGPYMSGKRDMLHMYTSSYVPNISTLIRARRPRTSGTAPSGVLLVGQLEAATARDIRLPNTNDELQRVETYAKKTTDTTTLTSSLAVRDAVITGLKTHSWVHLACHGHRNDFQPFSSHFSLHDGPLSLLDLIKIQLPDAELAVLSACHSAGANKDLPDEYLHPATGMMMAGFRGVVATLWALDDNIGPLFAEEFYKEMLGGPDGPKPATHAAFALRNAVKALGREKVPLMQRINLVHFGV